MSEERFAVVVLTEGLKGIDLDQEGVVEATGGELIDVTQASLTLSVPTEAAAQEGLARLVQAGLTEGTNAFIVRAEVPDWLDQYREVANSMSEHGG